MANFEKFAKDTIELGFLYAKALQATTPAEFEAAAAKMKKRVFEITEENTKLGATV